jgi:protein-S-isoprenylcysteine O-methyltransferase Ste14
MERILSCGSLRRRPAPIRRFEERQPLWIGTLFIFLPLAGYYLAPYMLISRHISLPPYFVGIVLCLFTTGIFLRYVGDAQKYYTLKLKQGLIEDGLFSRTRNPNCLGEILSYTSYALLSLHWLPFLILAGWVFGFFFRNMREKERSLSRHPEFDEYKKRTDLMLRCKLAEAAGSPYRMAASTSPRLIQLCIRSASRSNRLRPPTDSPKPSP